MSLTPGLQFYAEVISCLAPDVPTLRRTPSTYSYGANLELAPRPNDLYVVCQDGSVQSVWEPDRPIGWEIFETENGWSYRVTQVGFEPRPCLVRYHSRAEEIRPGGRGVGTCVLLAPLETYSRFAAIYEDAEEGEPEVTSRTPEGSPVSSPECPGAPRKASRNEFFS
jgi:hypothetical protein